MTSLREKVEKILDGMSMKSDQKISGMLHTFLIDCNEEEMCITLGFPAQQWETNPNGVIHGGIMATMIDTAIGISTIAVTEKFTPTMNLHISYLRPCPADGTVAVRAYITMLGGSVIQTRAEAYDTRDPRSLVTTAEGTYRLFKTSKNYFELI